MRNEGPVGAKMHLAKNLQRCLRNAKGHERELREERQEDAGTQPSEHERRGTRDKTNSVSSALLEIASVFSSDEQGGPQRDPMGGGSQNHVHNTLSHQSLLIVV